MLGHPVLYQPVPPWPFRVVPLGAGVPERQSSPSGAQSGCAARRDSLISAFSLWRQQFRSVHRGRKLERGCKTLLPGACGEVQPSPVLPGVGKLCQGVEWSEQASCVSRTEPDNRENSDPCTCSRNNEGVYINRAPCNCAKMITLPLMLLRVRRLLGFVMAWRSTSHKFICFNYYNCGGGGGY